ncbi:MAG: helix-turn-helix transcriptional regulator [Gammaproteobacteria bacterium]|nr:helix-turn-helix transcriptional regulator [Gammaproteobacteria bacterium]
MDDARLLSNDRAQEILTDAIRRFVGRGKKFTATELSEKTGIDERTINSWRHGESRPAYTKFMQVVAVLGPEFLNACLVDVGMSAGNVEADPMAPETASLDIDDFANEMMHRLLDDGQFCHRDKRASADKMIELGARMISTGHAWKNGGKASAPLTVVQGERKA